MSSFFTVKNLWFARWKQFVIVLHPKIETNFGLVWVELEVRIREFRATPKCDIYFRLAKRFHLIPFHFSQRFNDCLVITLKKRNLHRHHMRVRSARHLFAFNLFDDISISSLWMFFSAFPFCFFSLKNAADN